MKLISVCVQASLLLNLQTNVQSFTPSSGKILESLVKTNNVNVFGGRNTLHPVINDDNCGNSVHSKSITTLKLKSTDDGQEEGSGGFLSNLKINTPYALAYVFFIALAAYMNSAEPVGASQVLLEKFIADPLNPGVNELFTTEFNLLGLIGIPMACLVMPGSKGQSLPAPPFLFGSSLAGYGALGIYMSTRQSPDVTDNEGIGFVTKNILENKIFNWSVVALAISTFFVTGAVPAFMSDPQVLFSEYVTTVTSSALGFVSTVDLTILCLTAASLIPEDLERRGMTDSSKANAIALSTLLLPVLGPALYCALRPSLPEG